MPKKQTFQGRLDAAIRGWTGGGRKAFARAMKARGVSGHTYRTLLNYLNTNPGEGTTPSQVWIENAAAVTQVPLEWLRDGEGEARYEGELSQSYEERDLSLNEQYRRAGETVPALNELLREQEGGFREVWDRISRPYSDMFRRTALTLASTGAITLGDAASVLTAEGDLTKGRQYAKQYRLALRLLASCVSTANILTPGYEETKPDGVLLNGSELFEFQQLINIGQLIQDASVGVSIDRIMDRLARGDPLPSPWSQDGDERKPGTEEEV